MPDFLRLRIENIVEYPLDLRIQISQIDLCKRYAEPFQYGLKFLKAIRSSQFDPFHAQTVELSLIRLRELIRDKDITTPCDNRIGTFGIALSDQFHFAFVLRAIFEQVEIDLARKILSPALPL